MTREMPRDLLTLLEAQAGLSPQAPAFIAEDGQVLSRAMVLERSAAIAWALHAALSSKPGRRRIGVVLPNGGDLALTLLGAMLAGVAVPFNPALGADDAMAALTRARIDLLVVNQATAGGALASAAARLGIRVFYRSISAEPETAWGRLKRPDPDEIAVVLQTSGSTGGGKLVPLSHLNICASAGDVARSLALGAGDRCLAMWEQHHIGGVVDLLLAPLISGGTVVMTAGFDAGRFFDLLSKVQPTWFQGVPATLAELVLMAKRTGAQGGGSLRLIRSVAAALSPSCLAELEAVFGVPVIQTFGMTEAGPLITSTALPPGTRKPGSVGRPCGPTIRILGADGNDVPAGDVGEVAIRGENVFFGYEDDPDANAQAFRDGWFLTGDLGYCDNDGDLFLTGRLKQQINRGGEKFSPNEIDAVLTDHPAIAAAAAFAVPHKSLGEDVAAAVVLLPGQVLSASDLRAWVTGRLAPFKVPGRVIFLESLPRTPVGKVDRPALVALAAQRQQTAPSGAADLPDNPLQDIVAEIWAKELDLPTVEADDDFAELGGDSLSALRIHLALEQAFRVRITEAEARKLRTVRATASFLGQRGAVLQKTDAVGQTEPGKAMVQIDLATLYASLRECQRNTELRARIDTVTVKSTPAELVALVSAAPTLSPAVAQPFGVRTNLWLWRTGLRLRLARHRRSQAWSRRPLTAHLDLYDSDGSDTSGKTLIVGFSGNKMRLMLPAWNILVHLDPGSYSLLIVCDPARGHFAAGVPGLGRDLPDLAHTLAGHAKGYARTMALGTSAGGLASIAVAELNRWDGAVTVGADRPSAHPEIATLFQAFSSGAVRTRVCYGADRARDAEAAQEIAAILGTAELEPYHGVRQHNLLLHLMRRRRLAAAFNTWFAAVPTKALAAD
jgi:acyl carrier protein